MNKIRLLTAIGCVLCIALTSIASTLTSVDKLARTASIKVIMKKAHKDKLLDKVLGGKASVREKQQLALLYVDLAKNKPKKGSANSWKALTTPLAQAAIAVAKGDNKAMGTLKSASNCKGCHSKHK
jgi:hypothetical protein